MNIQFYLVCFFILILSFAQAKDKTKKNGKNKKQTELETTSESKKIQSKLSAHDIEENNLFFDAQRLKAIGDNKNAIPAFEKVLSFNPNNHAALFELARLYYINQEDDKSLKYISSAVKLMPNNLWYNLVYAQVLAVKGEFKLATNIYDKILTIEPREIAYYYDKANLLENSGDINKTLEFYDYIEKIFGIDNYGIEQKKRLYISLNKIDKAALEVQKLISTDSTNIDYYYMLASLYSSNKQNDKALPLYNYILSINPDYPQVLLAMADISYQKGDKNQAIQYTTKAFANSDLSIDTKVKILYQYIQFYKTKKEEINDAYNLASAMRNAHPNDAKAYAMSADIYYIDGKDSTALFFYEKSLEYSKDIYTVWQQTMLLCSEQQKFDLLKKYSNDAIELFPSQAMPYYFNAIAMNQFKRYRDAVTVLEEAYKLSKDNTNLRIQILANLGDNYHEMGNNTLSDSCFETALKLDSKNSYILNNYAYYLSLRKDQLNRSKEYAEMALKIDPNNPNYLDTYAWILFQMEDYTQAEEYQLKALRNSNLNDPTLFEHYGDILFKLNKIDDALIAWKKAKEKGSESINLDKKILNKKWYENE